jgi:hypothetical protein
VVSSVGHVNSDVDFDDIHFVRRPYDPWLAYGQSKTANVLFAVEAGRLWAADGITVNALNPGRIPGTNLVRHIGDVDSAPTSFEPNSTAVSWKTPAQGAATSVLLAGSPLLTGVTGRYFEDCAEAEPPPSTPSMPPACGRCRSTPSAGLNTVASVGAEKYLESLNQARTQFIRLTLKQLEIA